jgi:predicted RNA-binding Zn-ribbon protein involved in translation (DUF1610 family)
MESNAMSNRSRYLELRCPACGWRETSGPAAIADRLRKLGKLRPRSEPEWAILEGLMAASAGDVACPECGRRGVGVAPAADPDVKWPDVVACESCGGPIPAERLEVLPGATLCASCQGNEDRGAACGAVEYCPRCGSVMEPRLARGRGITRYVMTCTAAPPCRKARW